MKKIFAAVAFAAMLLTGAAHAEVQIGKPAPDFTFKDIKGVEHSIKGFEGKTVVLEWHNPGCPFVKKFYDAGMMQKFQETQYKNLPVVWIAINSGAEGKEGYFASDAEAQKYLDEKGFKGAAYVRDTTGAFGKLYGAKTTPHMFVISAKGDVVYQGAIDNIKSADADDINKANNYVTTALQDLAEGRTPQVTSTDAYGCGVKYAD